MRVVLALLFLAPVVAMTAVKNGVDQILPLMIGMSLIAIAAYFFIESRREED